MSRKYFRLNRIDNEYAITRQTDGEFLHHLQTGLLLALKELGQLNEVQYHHAQAYLDQQSNQWYKRC